MIPEALRAAVKLNRVIIGLNVAVDSAHVGIVEEAGRMLDDGQQFPVHASPGLRNLIIAGGEMAFPGLVFQPES